MKIIRERERVTATSYSLNFDIDDCGGFSFPCDEDGNVFVNDMMDCAKENYKNCLEHPEKFIRKPYVHKESWSYMENALAKCICGEEFELYDEYEGACECPRCGRWYNLFGQELLKPEYWEQDIEEEAW